MAAGLSRHGSRSAHLGCFTSPGVSPTGFLGQGSTNRPDLCPRKLGGGAFDPTWSAGEERTSDEIGAERSEDGEIQEPGRGHDSGVLALASAARVTNTSPIVVIAHVTHIQPRIPL